MRILIILIFFLLSVSNRSLANEINIGGAFGSLITGIVKEVEGLGTTSKVENKDASKVESKNDKTNSSSNSTSTSLNKETRSNSSNKPRASVEVALQSRPNSYVPNDVWIQPLSKTNTNILSYEFFKANEYGEWLSDYIYYRTFNESRQNIRDANEMLAKLNGFGYELLVGEVVITDLSPETIVPLINSYIAKDSEILWDIKLFSKVPLKFNNIQCAYVSPFRECYGQFGNLPGVKEKTAVIVSFNNFWNNVTKGIKLYSGDVFLFSGEMQNPFTPVIGTNTVNIPVSNLDEVKLIMEEKIFYLGLRTSEPETPTFFEDDGRTYDGGNSMSMTANNFFFIK